MGSKTEIAVAKLLEGYSCAQAVFYSFCEDLQFDKNIALRLACGFGAGMARRGEVCGAVTGGMLVLGARYGRGEKDDWAATGLTYRKTHALMDQFAEKHGTYNCRTLLNGCDLATEEGQRHFKENGLLTKICVPCVQSAVEILEGL